MVSAGKRKRAARQQLFYALAEPTRRNIVEMLATNGQLSATEICNNFTVSPQAISQHLKVLREAELVRVEKRAQQRIYQINPDAMLELSEWIAKVTEQWNERFDALDEVLAAEKRKIATKQDKDGGPDSLG
jgi:DNA-binding transcriptional ArsR family regulator